MIVCKFSKYNKYNKPLFKVSESIDRDSYERVKSAYDKLETDENYKYNPIYEYVNDKNEVCYYLTINNNQQNLQQYKLYEIYTECIVENDNYPNFYITKLKKIKDKKEKRLNLL